METGRRCNAKPKAVGYKLTLLPSELWSLTTLQEVEVLMSNFKLANMFQELQMEIGFKLHIYPPLDADFYVNPKD
jgi:hypothetical protein